MSEWEKARDEAVLKHIDSINLFSSHNEGLADALRMNAIRGFELGSDFGRSYEQKRAEALAEARALDAEYVADGINETAKKNSEYDDWKLAKANERIAELEAEAKRYKSALESFAAIGDRWLTYPSKFIECRDKARKALGAKDE